MLDQLSRALATVTKTKAGVPMFIASGPTVPTDAAKGYAKGCLFIHTDAANQADAWYVNIGTAASCNFNAVTIASD